MRGSLALVLLYVILQPSFAVADKEAEVERAQAGGLDVAEEVACALTLAKTLGTCQADVTYADHDRVAIVVTFPVGFARTLFFKDGDFVRGNATMSGVGTDTDWHLADGVYHVRVDDQRFEIPQALVYGN